MLFTHTPPSRQDGAIRLFFSPEEAGSAAGKGNPVFGVAVHYDGLNHRLLPLDASALEDSAPLPARYESDGSIVALSPIPRLLYLNDQTGGAKETAREVKR